MNNNLEILVESMNFEVPLVTNMHPEPPPAGSSVAARFNGIAQGWSTTNEGEDSMEVKRIGTVLLGDPTFLLGLYVQSKCAYLVC